MDGNVLKSGAYQSIFLSLFFCDDIINVLKRDRKKKFFCLFVDICGKQTCMAWCVMCLPVEMKIAWIDLWACQKLIQVYCFSIHMWHASSFMHMLVTWVFVPSFHDGTLLVPLQLYKDGTAPGNRKFTIWLHSTCQLCIWPCSCLKCSVVLCCVDLKPCFYAFSQVRKQSFNCNVSLFTHLRFILEN
jgi:hypothetical protein